MKKKIISLVIFFCSVFFLVPSKTNAAGMEANMVSPRYRNAIFASMGNLSAIKIRIKYENPYYCKKIRAKLSRNGSQVKSWELTGTASPQLIQLSTSGITFQNTRNQPYEKDTSPYLINLECADASGYTRYKTSLNLYKYPAAPVGVKEVRIDDDGNVLVSGVKTFINGAYLNRTAANYSYLEEKGIRSFLESKDNLTGNLHSANSTGLVHVSETNAEATRSIVKSIRSKANLLGYHISDEPNLRNVDPAKLRAAYDVIRDEDPYHPAVIVMPFGQHWGRINSYTGTQDLIGADIYPLWKGTTNHQTDISEITSYFKMLRSANSLSSSFEHYDTPSYGIPQIFTLELPDSYGGLDWRLPNKTEMKNMTYQFLACGAKMLFPYTYDLRWTTNDIWNYYTSIINNEVKKIETAIFAPEKGGTTSKGQEGKVSISGFRDGELTWSFRETADTEYLFLINTTNKWDDGWQKNTDLSLKISFKQSGNNVATSLVRDSSMPASYSLTNGIVSLKLSGVNENSSGVLVLSRSKSGTGGITPPPVGGNCDARGQDIIADKIFNIADVYELEKRFYNLSSGTKTDVNKDGQFNYNDVQYLIDCHLCKLNWTGCSY